MNSTIYPSIHLDTFSYCNAKCAFCSYHKMTRPKGKMSLELFSKVVDEMATWPVPVEISPVHYGEFFLNPDWYYILKHIEERLPNCRISIPTNGSQFTEELMDKLASIKNLYYLSFSLYAHDVDTYKSLIGLSEECFHKVEAAFHSMRRRRPDVGVVLGSTFSSLFMSPFETYKLQVKWGDYANSHDITLNKSHGFTKSFPTKEVCSDPFLCLVVLWDGRVCCCCMDPNGELIVGDANSSKIMEIWNGEAINKIRKYHNDGNRVAIPMCDSCTCTKARRSVIHYNESV
jgi:hypothetical protein